MKVVFKISINSQDNKCFLNMYLKENLGKIKSKKQCLLFKKYF